MKTTIDASGRLVIPKFIRKVTVLESGVPLEIRWREGIVEIEPVPLPVILTKQGRFLWSLFLKSQSHLLPTRRSSTLGSKYATVDLARLSHAC